MPNSAVQFNQLKKTILSYEDATEYDTTYEGKKYHCYKTHGTENWYIMICNRYGLRYERGEGISYEAEVGDGASFDYVEGDCILSQEI